MANDLTGSLSDGAASSDSTTTVVVIALSPIGASGVKLLTVANLKAALAAANVQDGDVLQFVSIKSPEAPARVTRYVDPDGATPTVYIEQ
jgi:hypothetical protein